MLCGVARDDHGQDVQSSGAAAQAVDVGDVGTLVIHWLHKLQEEGSCIHETAKQPYIFLIYQIGAIEEALKIQNGLSVFLIKILNKVD